MTRSATARTWAESPPPSFPTASASRSGARSGSRAAAGVRNPERDLRAVLRNDSTASHGGVESRVMEVRAHCATDDFGVPHVNRSGQGNGGICPQRGSRTDDRADVARVLDRVEQQDPHWIGCDKCVQRAFRRAGDGDDALRRLGFGRTPELLFIDFSDFESSRPRRFDNRDAPSRNRSASARPGGH